MKRLNQELWDMMLSVNQAVPTTLPRVLPAMREMGLGICLYLFYLGRRRMSRVLPTRLQSAGYSVWRTLFAWKKKTEFVPVSSAQGSSILKSSAPGEANA
jgi:hypothetical protein